MTATRLLQLDPNYTDRDFAALRERVFRLIRTVFPTWTDDSVADFGNLLVETFCFVGDVLAVYLDNAAAEAFAPTARLRRSLLNLARRTGYRPSGPRAATADELFVLASGPAAATVTIPRGDRVRTADVTSPIFYQLLEDLVFEPGETAKTATVENSQSVAVALASTGAPNQQFTLGGVPYVDGSAEVSAENGGYSEPPAPFSDVLDGSSSVDRHFVVSVDANDRATIRFGDGVNGEIPLGTVDVRYKVGGGAAGRVEAGKLVRLEKSSYTDANGAAVQITCTNQERSSGGTDRETNAQVARNIPLSLRALTRTVSREDAEIVAERVPGVARAVHVTSNEVAGVAENTGRLFVVPVGGGTASEALLDEVRAQFAPDGPFPTTNTYQLDVASAVYLQVDVSAIVYLRSGYSQPAVRASILAALNAFFAVSLADGTPNPTINFGYYLLQEFGSSVLAWDAIRSAILRAAGVAKLDAGPSGMLLNGERSDVEVEAFRFPTLGDVVLVNGSTGLQF